MPKNAKDARIFIKFAEDGTRADTRIEDANLYIIPPQPIVELRNGEEILRVIPEHYEDDPEQGTILVPGQRIPTGQYEQVEVTTGYTEEILADSIAEDGTYIPFNPADYIEVTYAEYLLLSGNSPDGKMYIRNMTTGEYIEQPPYVPTAAEKLAVLDAEYEAQFDEINNQIILAVAENNEALKAELMEEKAALVEEYTTKRGAIE